jgi:hypothetical protein
MSENTASVTLLGFELWNAFHALLEAKFHENPYDHRIAPSPIIAEILEKMANVIGASGLGGKEWAQWLELAPDRREWRVALNHVRLEQEWLDEPHANRVEYAKRLLSPFRVGETLIERFLSEALEMKRV